jgi:hypothetical protein
MVKCYESRGNRRNRPGKITLRAVAELVFTSAPTVFAYPGRTVPAVRLGVSAGFAAGPRRENVPAAAGATTTALLDRGTARGAADLPIKIVGSGVLTFRRFGWHI